MQMILVDFFYNLMNKSKNNRENHLQVQNQQKKKERKYKILFSPKNFVVVRLATDLN